MMVADSLRYFFSVHNCKKKKGKSNLNKKKHILDKKRVAGTVHDKVASNRHFRRTNPGKADSISSLYFFYFWGVKLIYEFQSGLPLEEE